MVEVIDGEFQDNTHSESIVAYQYNDLQKAAKAILAKATQTANSKIEQAKKNIAELEEKMRQQGYDKGVAEGLLKGEADGKAAGEAAAKSEFAASVDGINGALHNLLGELNFRKLTIQAQAEADLLKLALDIAQRIVRREVLVDESFVVPIVHEAIALTNNRNDLLVKLNPHDRDIVSDEIPTLKAIFNDIGRIKLIDDEEVERGGVRVVSREGEVDMRLEEQLKALEKALIGDTAGMQKWDGQAKTEIPVTQSADLVNTASLPQATREAAPVLAPTGEQNPASVPAQASAPVADTKPKIKPEPRKRLKSKQVTSSPESNSQAVPSATAHPEASESVTPVEPQVEASPAQTVKSSLADVAELTSFTLDSEVEAAISDVLSAEDSSEG